METPITVIGWEQSPKKNGGFNIRLYGTRQLAVAEGCEGAGTEAIRTYYNPEYVDYKPVIGDVIIIIEGKFGIERVIKVA